MIVRAKSKRRSPAAVLIGLMALIACSPPQRLYSTHPVDRDGDPLPFERATAVVFESGSTLHLRPGERLVLDGTLVELIPAPGQPDARLRSWPLSQVKQLKWTSMEGENVEADVLTPDDLQSYETLPRIRRIVMRDGHTVEITKGIRTRWAPGELALEVVDADDEITDLALPDIAEVELHQSNLVASTFKSPAFWIAGAAAAGLYVIAIRQPERRSTAIK